MFFVKVAAVFQRGHSVANLARLIIREVCDLTFDLACGWLQHECTRRWFRFKWRSSSGWIYLRYQLGFHAHLFRRYTPLCVNVDLIFPLDHGLYGILNF